LIRRVRRSQADFRLFPARYPQNAGMFSDLAASLARAAQEFGLVGSEVVS